MDTKKLALFFAFAFVITGIVVYQVRTTRGKAVASPVAATPTSAAAPLAPQASPAPLPPVSLKEVEGKAPQSASVLPAFSIPTNGWGRSPFLTVEELRKLNEPDAPAPVIQPPVAAAPVVEPLPQYLFQGTNISRNNKIAYINDKQFRVGDKIGKEVVKEIKDGSVILEQTSGQTRELSQKTNAAAEPVQPKGE